ncbi:myelin-oligodendrocyte glycoprotein-like [Neolamprologus brichardi]|uniref:myelin-oligodendrocyte glycoprotein-like n=1 Tax=Neolamprologus brichardi TaxID=32507 RepID=UPI001643924E|nr:myelin-oligodendrocyte glycoprotein-like [Neolamprologus brichardi]
MVTVNLQICGPIRLAQGQLHVVGSLQPVVAAPGDDVILPCQVEPAFNVAGLTVEWSKPDLRPDPNDRLSRVEYVHLYRDAHEVPDMKLPSYIGRTALFTDSLRDGNISLRITNVTLEDQGRYRCFIPKLKGQTKFSIVRLIVDPSLTETATTETQLDPENFHVPDLNEEIDNKAEYVCGLRYEYMYYECKAAVTGVLRDNEQTSMHAKFNAALIIVTLSHS